MRSCLLNNLINDVYSPNSNIWITNVYVHSKYLCKRIKLEAADSYSYKIIEGEKYKCSDYINIR